MKVFQGIFKMDRQIGLLEKGLLNQGYYVSSHQDIYSECFLDLFEKSKKKYEIYHFHSLTFSNLREAFRYARKTNKVRLMHYWGSDVRRGDVVGRHNPFVQLMEQFPDFDANKKLISRQSRYIPACIVPNFEVVPYVTPYYDRVYVLPIATELVGKKSDIQQEPNQVPVIVHVARKGYYNDSQYIKATLNDLREGGVRFHYIEAKDISHQEVVTLYEKADIVIDQVLCGYYSSYAVEAMAQGKAVISYIRQDLKSFLGIAMPIFSASPATLYAALKKLIENPLIRIQAGIDGNVFVERYHELSLVSKQLAWIYRFEERALNGEIMESLPGQFVAAFIGKSIRFHNIDPEMREIGGNTVQLLL